MEREVEVFIDIDGATHFVGRLWPRVTKGHESASFKYDEQWLRSPLRFALEPALLIDDRTHHTQPGFSLFGAIGDSSPDRWGRILMKRLERKIAQKEGRAPRTLMEIDYLLNVDDRLRQGALRFRLPGGQFLANEVSAIPPLIQLPRLLSASDRVLEDRESDEDLRILLAPGSSLGGARPKAAVIDSDGSLAIAKFPDSGDEYSVERWSYLALRLAEKAGISVPPCRIEDIGGKKVLLVTRFDRSGAKRIPFLSGMSMIGAVDHEKTHSYLELVDALRQHGSDTKSDLAELWKRVLFSVLVSNVDDHLRNHGFLYDTQDNGWRLSPAYDINPVPRDVKPGYLSMLIDENDSESSFDLVMSTYSYYGLDNASVSEIVRDVVVAVSVWDREAAIIGIKQSEIERMSSAFQNQAFNDARNFLGKSGENFKR